MKEVGIAIIVTILIGMVLTITSQQDQEALKTCISKGHTESYCITNLYGN